MSKTLADCLRDIGEEKVKININGKKYNCSRTEATARKMHLMASGGYEEVKDEEGESVRVNYKADAKVAKMIREFVDGKAAQEAPKEEKKQAKPGQYNSEISRRLNDRLGGGSMPEPGAPARPRIPKGIT